VGSNVGTMTSKSIGKRRIDPYISETPRNLLQKLNVLITSWGATIMPIFMGIGPEVSASQIAKI